MGQKCPLYTLQFSRVRKFVAVHGPSPLGLEKAVIQSPLHGQTMPASICSSNKHFLTAYSMPANVVGTGDKVISKTHSRFLGPQNTHR